ncbi:MAG: VOC family protein [Betaproteobacteria bacterium]|nr:MAG: VOC family protein [Betaproteobacteria bacterium]
MAAASRPFAVARIDHVVLRCRDVNAMLEFYGEVLGLEVAKRNERIGLIHLRAGSAMVDLIPMADPPADAGESASTAERRNMDHLCLRIQPFDLPRLQAYFGAHGITPGELRVRFGAEGDGASFYIDDPEGNRVELKGPSTGV